MKRCVRCDKDKEDSEFNFKSKKEGTLNAYCRVCQSEYHALYYEKHKRTYLDKAQKRRETEDAFWFDEIRKIKNVPCMDCGHNFPPVCMDFDHRDPEQKVGTISSMIGSNCKREDIFEEIEKCDIVCANCHRIRHLGSE